LKAMFFGPKKTENRSLNLPVKETLKFTLYIYKIHCITLAPNFEVLDKK